MLMFFLQRDAGWCEASEEMSRTHSRAAARNSVSGRVDADGIPAVTRAGYKTYRPYP